ncbi:hypothetical protein IscW_ISCW015821 [Ixodes scapularis]|uniref:Uncharacterized protein n=1 Tax=Ixodes scapularis TaxID=6945 RepID=B7P3A5_IXOSC|nr:hypothetical protein IscW_ISCW015821 [Ixodes scapularis]|eukprot:XP_002403790.1 hypothetical protein IscW_ISCW015821 [Ixodes scapularis]
MSLSGNRKKLLQYSLAQIEDCIRNEEFGRALAHFCVVFKLQPTAKDELKEAFLLAVVKDTLKLQECDLVSEESDEDPYTTERLSRIKHGYRCLSEPLNLISVNFNDRRVS